MKGFLQRIAAHAARPQANIHPVLHPMVGSLWSVTRRETAGEALTQETIVSTVAQSEPIPTPMKTSRTSSDWGRGEASAGSPSRETASEMIVGQPSAEDSPFQPLLAAEAETALMRDRVGPRAATPRQESAREERTTPELSDRVSGADDVVFKDAVRPEGGAELTPASIMPRSAPPSENSNPFSAETRRRALPAQFPAPVATTRGPDEIQINIGRIEVTAVPQPTPRVAAPPRKSVNLDEYLKRRDGRNG